MDQVRVSDQWTVAGTVADVQAAATEFLLSRGMRVVGEQPGEVHARRTPPGFARLFGRLAPAGWLPYRAVVRLRPGPGGVGVRAEVESAAEAGPTAAYHQLFDRWIDGLRRAFPAPRSAVPA